MSELTRVPSKARRSLSLFVSVGVALATLAAPAAPAAPARAADPFEPTFGGMILDGLSRGLEAAIAYGRAKARFNDEIAAARRKYWSAWPDGAGVEEAGAEYRKLLAGKDIVNILPSLVCGPTQGLGWARGLDVLSSPEWTESGVVRLDGGVRERAEPALRAMAEAIRASAGLTPDPPSPAPLEELLILPSPAASRAIAANREAVEAYLVARNRAEMLAGLKYVPFADDRDYLAHRLMLEDAFATVDEARSYLARMEEVLGPGPVDETAAAIRGLPVNSEGALTGAGRLDSCSPDDREAKTFRARTLLDLYPGTSSARSYALTMIRLERHLDWRGALEVYDEYWVAPFGEAAVLAAAERVRSAPKQAASGGGWLTEEIRHTRRPPEAMRRLMPHDPYRDYPLASLDAPDPEKYLYAVLRHFGDVEYWSEVPAAYEELVRRWGATRLMEAVDRLRAARKNGDGSLAAPAELGVSSSNPAKALAEILEQGKTSARSYFADLFSTPYCDGAREYDALAACFGKPHLDRVIDRVREAERGHVDLKTLEGAVSGFDQPAPALLDVLWSTASPEAYHHYAVWRWKVHAYADRSSRLDREECDARVRETVAEQRESFGRENLAAAARGIASAPKRPFTLADYYARKAPRLVAPRAVNPDLLRSADEVETLVDFNYVFRLAGILRNPDSRPTTAFRAGEEFEFRFRGAWHRAKILRVQPGVGGPRYLVQVDLPGQAPFWAMELGLKQNSRPLSDSAGRGEGDEETPEKSDPKRPGGSEEKEKEDEKPAPEEPAFPVGSRVRLHVNNRTYDGTVLDHRVRNGVESYLVEYEFRRGRKSKSWFEAKYVRPPETR